MDCTSGIAEAAIAFGRRRIVKPRTAVVPIGFTNYSDHPGYDDFNPEFLLLGHETLLHRALNEVVNTGIQRVIFVVRSDLKGFHSGVRGTIYDALSLTKSTRQSPRNSSEAIRRLVDNAVYLYVDGALSIDLALCDASQWVPERKFAVILPGHILFAGQECDSYELGRLTHEHQKHGQSVLGVAKVTWDKAILGTSFDIQSVETGGHRFAGVHDDADRANLETCFVSSGRAIIDTQLLYPIWESRKRKPLSNFVSLAQTARNINAPLHAHATDLDLVECDGQFNYGLAIRRLHGATGVTNKALEKRMLSFLGDEGAQTPERRSELG